MARNKSTKEKLEEQIKVAEAAQKKVEELQKKYEEEEAAKKQKKIESITDDFRAALANSPILEYKKTSDEYKSVLRMIRTGVIEKKIEACADPAPAAPAEPTIYEQIGRLAEQELGRPLVEGDQTYFAGFIQEQDRRGSYYRNAFPKEV